MSADDCQCRKCVDERGDGTHSPFGFIPATASRMILCEVCGNKRCPHANDHDNACTGSNDPGQAGSAYA